MSNYNKITALYSRLSVGDEDRDGGESNSMQNFMRTYQRDFSRRNVFKCLQIATTKNRLN